MLTMPMTSRKAIQISAHLPAPVSQWVAPALAQQHKQFSIRYVGVAIMSSVLVGVGTAEAMRLRQARIRRQQALWQGVDVVASDASSASWLQTAGQVEGQLSGLKDLTASLEPTTLPAWGDQIDQRHDTESVLDWAALLDGPIKSAPDDHLSSPDLVPSAPLLAVQPTYRIQTAEGNQRLLAIKVNGDYYSFYRQRPTAEKADAVAAQLQRRGKTTIVTADAKGHTIWVHQPGARLDQSCWSALQSAG